MKAPEPLLGRTLLVVAHADDESVGAGALLQRISEPVVAFCTDGAPRDKFFWGKYGSRLRYARLREEEARTALSLTGVNELVFLGEQSGAMELFVDQELYRAIPQAVNALEEIVRRYRPQALLTTAYEGGHPDHDVCSFLTAVLAHSHGLPAWEFPLYHRQHTVGDGRDDEAGELVFQRFLVPDVREETVLEIAPDEVEVKRQMLAAYASQHPFLFEFDVALERSRPQRAYDYSRPPHDGVLNYEAWHWGVSGRDVCTACTEFLQKRRQTG